MYVVCGLFAMCVYVFNLLCVCALLYVGLGLVLLRLLLLSLVLSLGDALCYFDVAADVAVVACYCCGS